MFPTAEKVTLWKLFDQEGNSLGLFQRLSTREAMGNPGARQAEVAVKNKQTGEVTRAYHFYVPVQT